MRSCTEKIEQNILNIKLEFNLMLEIDLFDRINKINFEIKIKVRKYFSISK